MNSSREVFGIPRRSNSQNSFIQLGGVAAYGSTNVAIIQYLYLIDQAGSDITRISNSVEGDKFIINTDGYYSITMGASFSAGIGTFGVILNGSITEITATTIITAAATTPPSKTVVGIMQSPSANTPAAITVCKYLYAGDIIRPQADTNGFSNSYQQTFLIAKVGR